MGGCCSSLLARQRHKSSSTKDCHYLKTTTPAIIQQHHQKQLPHSAIQQCFQTIFAMNTTGMLPVTMNSVDKPQLVESAKPACCPFHARRRKGLPPHSQMTFLQMLVQRQRSRQSRLESVSSSRKTTMTLASSKPDTAAAPPHNQDVAAAAVAASSFSSSSSSSPLTTPHARTLLKVKSSSIDQPDQQQRRRQASMLRQQQQQQQQQQATSAHWSQLTTTSSNSSSNHIMRLQDDHQHTNDDANVKLLPTSSTNDTTMRTADGHQYPRFAAMFQGPAHSHRRQAARASDEDDGYVYLNQYKLSNQTLGHGTYSIVKLAYNTADNNHYAMKILSKKKLMKKHRLTRKTGDPMQEAYREIAILKKLNHPNIIRLIEVLDDPSDDFLYMAFELLERGEVLAVPTDTPLSEATVWSYFRDLVLGVEYLHYNGILHRDLKPSNLLLADNGRLKIADFGLSHMFEGPDVLLGSTVGTPAFHAPELLSVTTNASSPTSSGPKSHPNSRASSPVENGRGAFSGTAMDMWSMGITLYSLVFGDVPFRDQFIVGLYNQIRSFPPSFPSTIAVSDELQDCIIRLLEKDPTKRMTISELREHPWVTRAGTALLLPSAADNCHVPISVTEEEIRTSVRSIPHLDTLILVKAMLKRASFHHPFKSDDRKGSLDSNYPYSKMSGAT